jgi:hypothetical protein
MWSPGVHLTVRCCGLAAACLLPLAGCAAPASGPVDAAQAPFTPRGQDWDSTGRAADGARESQAAALADPAERAVATAVDRYWTEVQRATVDPRPGAPGLAAVAAGRALSAWRTKVALLAEQDLRYVGEIRHRVTAGTLAGRTATARGCVDASTWRAVDRTGRQVARPQPPTAYSYRLSAAGGGWRVNGFTVGGRCSLDAS